MPRAPKPSVAAPRRVRLLIATRKGLWTLTGDATRRTWKLAGPQFLGHIVHHAMLDPRDGKTLLAAARTGHLGPTVFRSVDGGRSWKEASKPPAFAAGQRARGRPYVLADAGACVAAGRVVRRHVAAGLVPVRRRRRDVGRCGGIQRAPAAQGLVRRRPGRHAGRPEAAFDPDRSARSDAHVHRDVERRRRSSPAMAAPIGIRSTPACAPISSPIPISSTATIRTACASPAAIRIGSISRIIAACSGSTGRPRAGRTSAPACPSRSATSAFRWSPHPHDANTAWIFPMDGTDRVAARIARRQAGGLSHARRRQVLEAPGRRHAEGAGVVDGQAAGDDGRCVSDRGRLFRHDVRRGMGQPRRRPHVEVPGRASAAHLRGRVCGVADYGAPRMSSLARRNIRRRHSDRAALLHRRRRQGDGVAGTPSAAARAWPTCSRRSTPPYPGIRFRMMDEAGRVRPHVQVFVDARSSAIRRRRCRRTRRS